MPDNLDELANDLINSSNWYVCTWVRIK